MNKEYKLVESSNINKVEEQINKLASQGWLPNGDLNTQALMGTIYYTHVMVREKSDINENSGNGKQLLHG